MKKERKHEIVAQDWEESERGWGVRPDGASLHQNASDLERFVKKYWNGMPDAVPDEYSRPSGDYYILLVPESVYNEVKASEYGIWISQSTLYDLRHGGKRNDSKKLK